MTVIVMVGRRVPKSWYRAGVQKIKGIFSFQEHIWSIISQSFNLAKRKANASNSGINFVVHRPHREDEDLNYQLEWIKVIIQGTREQEEEEYNEAMSMYLQFNKILKKESFKGEEMTKYFGTAMLSPTQLNEAYEKGYGAVGDNNIANKLLELGILTHIEWVDDCDTRVF